MRQADQAASDSPDWVRLFTDSTGSCVAVSLSSRCRMYLISHSCCATVRRSILRRSSSSVTVEEWRVFIGPARPFRSKDASLRQAVGPWEYKEKSLLS